jgi:hypothetical protein
MRIAAHKAILGATHMRGDSLRNHYSLVTLGAVDQSSSGPFIAGFKAATRTASSVEATT